MCSSDLAALKNHYLKFGIKEGRSASPIFDPKFYLSNNGDLRRVFGNNGYAEAYYHFIRFGIHEGRQGSPYFSVNYYLNRYGDIRKAYYSSKSLALYHFAKFGINEGRQGTADFNVTAYYNSQNTYTKRQLGKNYIKYFALKSGANVINDPKINITNYMFDAKYYADKYGDLKKAFGYNEADLKNHYLKFGIKEGRSASPIFDPKFYLSKNADLRKAFGSNGYVAAYNHFISHGIHEGRQGSASFSVRIYLNRYGDLSAAFGPNYSKAAEHYFMYGIKEGRKGN